jgi:hypothetical protein
VLWALWKSGRSDGSKIGGLLPFSDADEPEGGQDGPEP